MGGPESRARINSTPKKNLRTGNSAKELEGPFYIHKRTEVRRIIPEILNSDSSLEMSNIRKALINKMRADSYKMSTSGLLVAVREANTKAASPL